MHCWWEGTLCSDYGRHYANSSSSTPNENSNKKGYMYPYVHWNIIYNSQSMVAIEMLLYILHI